MKHNPWFFLVSLLLVWSLVSTASAQETSNQCLPQAPIEIYAELPRFHNVGTLFDEFRNQIRDKISQLATNYIRRVSKTRYVFEDDKEYLCSKNKIPVREMIAAIEVNTELKDDLRRETISYFTCKGQLIFTENFETRGKELTESNTQQLLTGVRPFILESNEDSETYTLSDSKRMEMLKVHYKKDDQKAQKTKADFFILGQPALSYYENIGKKQSQVSYIVYPLNISYKYDNGGFNVNYNIDSNLEFKISGTDKGQIFYFYNSAKATTFSQFITQFQSHVLGITIFVYRAIIDGFLGALPATEIVSTGSKSDRLLEELNINLSRLVNNVEINEVRVFLQDFKNSVEAGFIKDERPAKAK